MTSQTPPPDEPDRGPAGLSRPDAAGGSDRAADPAGIPSTRFPPGGDSAGLPSPGEPAGGAEGGEGTAAARVVALFGGIRPMATKLGVPVTTVQGWKKRGAIPEGRHADILAAAQRNGLAIDAGLLAATAPPEPGEAGLREGMVLPEPAVPLVGRPDTDRPSEPQGGSAPDLASDVRTSGQPVDPPIPSFLTSPRSTMRSDDDLADSRVPPAADPPPRAGGAGTAWIAAAVAVIGAVGAATAPLWAPGLLPSVWSAPAAEAVDPERLAALEQRLANLEQARGEAPEPDGTAADGTSGVDTAALQAGLNALAGRIESLETARADAGAAAADTTDASALASRIAALEEASGRPEAAVADLAGRVAALEQGGDAAVTTADLAARLDRLEQAAPAAEAGRADADRIEQSLGALEGRLASLEQAGTELRQAVDTATERAETAAIGTAETATRVEDLSATVARLGTVDTSAQALVLSIGQLRDAAATGRPFADALSAIRGLEAADDALLAPLAAHAETGVPTVAELAASFPVVRDAVLAAADEGAAESWLDRSLGSLRGLVTVRRVAGEVEGDDVDAILARAEARLGAGDLAGAVEALSALDGPAAEAASSWIGDANARVAVDEALRAASTAALARLGASGGATEPEAADTPAP